MKERASIRYRMLNVCFLHFNEGELQHVYYFSKSLEIAIVAKVTMYVCVLFIVGDNERENVAKNLAPQHWHLFKDSIVGTSTKKPHRIVIKMQINVMVELSMDSKGNVGGLQKRR